MSRLDWLLEGDSWVRYATQVTLLGYDSQSDAVAASKAATLSDPAVRALLDDITRWPWPPLTRHNDAAHPLHKLAFLASIGCSASDPGIDGVVDRLLADQSPEGAFRITLQTYPRFGGSGEPELGWMLCDGPLVAATLCELGLSQDSRVQHAMGYYVSLVQQNGWPCVVDAAMGRFRGPGKREDPCPYATLLMLRALSGLDREQDHPAARIGVETLLDLWDQRRERRPYLFAMGTHFARLKAPLIWYDIVHVLDVLSRYPWVYPEPRFREMMAILTAKADDQGRYTPESVWTHWKGWDFGQKKTPSRGLTLIIRRILSRVQAT
jgi:hypothetical protein